MKSTARMFDGMADGKSEAAGQFFQMKTDPYGSVEQLSGNSFLDLSL
jgi:hypothetical protein